MKLSTPNPAGALGEALREIERLSYVGSHAEANKAIRAFIYAHEAYSATSTSASPAAQQMGGKQSVGEKNE